MGVRGATSESQLIEAARQGDSDAFDALVAPLRGELHAHCYRMLGSVQDAEDALQEALLAAWRGFSGFAGPSSVRSWLYRITTRSCLRLSTRRHQRLLPAAYRPASQSVQDLCEAVTEVGWLEPYPDALFDPSGAADPAARYEQRERVELAFVAALQYLPATQRAVLILREVLAFSAAEIAGLLETTVASVNSALQRARRGLEARAPTESQQASLRSLGADGQRQLVQTFAAAWERADVTVILDLLVEDARFTMPPLPAWFDGRVAIGRFLTERVFETPWRLVPTAANGQLAFGCYQAQPEESSFRLGSISVLTLRGERIREITAFLDPVVRKGSGLPPEL